MSTPKKSQYDSSFYTKEGLTVYVKQAKKVSYGATRPLANVIGTIIHYTGNVNDSPAGNCSYFANGNTRAAGAHFFVGSDGTVFRSIKMTQTAYAVGGFYTQKNGAGKYYKKLMNSNTISIELCNYTKGYPADAQIAAVIKLIKYIKRKCPKMKYIARHWDVNGKTCPYAMIGTSNAQWKKFKKELKASGISATYA